MRARAGLVALVALTLAACGNFGPGTKIRQPVLTGESLVVLVYGNTFRARSEAGHAFDIYYREDGQVFLRGKRRDGYVLADQGLWSIESDRLCTRWQNLRGRTKTCEWVTWRANVFRTYDPAGNPSATGTLVEGITESVKTALQAIEK